MGNEGNPARVQAIHPEARPREALQLNQWLEQLVARMSLEAGVSSVSWAVYSEALE